MEVTSFVMSDPCKIRPRELCILERAMLRFLAGVVEGRYHDCEQKASAHHHLAVQSLNGCLVRPTTVQVQTEYVQTLVWIFLKRGPLLKTIAILQFSTNSVHLMLEIRLFNPLKYKINKII